MASLSILSQQIRQMRDISISLGLVTEANQLISVTENIAAIEEELIGLALNYDIPDIVFNNLRLAIMQVIRESRVLALRTGLCVPSIAWPCVVEGSRSTRNTQPSTQGYIWRSTVSYAWSFIFNPKVGWKRAITYSLTHIALFTSYNRVLKYAMCACSLPDNLV